MSEESDAVTEADIIIKAHELGIFMDNPDNRQIIRNRAEELIKNTEGFNWEGIDIVTKAVIMKLCHNILREDKVVLRDLKFVFTLGYVLAKT